MTTISKNARKLRRDTWATASDVIGQCLKEAVSRLREAGRGNLSTKNLHELRIACRRAEAALRLCREPTESPAWNWLRRHLRLLRRACNLARDDDVLRTWVRHQDSTANQSLRRAIREHRESLQPRIAKLAHRMAHNHRFERRSQRVVRQLRIDERNGNTARQFARRLFDELHRFVRALPDRRDDVSALHRLRIIGKRLRYASELVTQIWPTVELAELDEHLHSLQDRLGAIHDQVVGERRLRKHSLRRSGNAAPLLAQKSRSESQRLQRKFWNWWEACPLERMLADTTAEVLALMLMRS